MKKVLFIFLSTVLLFALSGCGKEKFPDPDLMDISNLTGTWNSIGFQTEVNDEIVDRLEDRKVELVINSEIDASIKLTEVDGTVRNYKAIFDLDGNFETRTNDFRFFYDETDEEGQTETIEEAGWYTFVNNNDEFIKNQFMGQEIDGSMLYLCIDGDSWNCFVMTK